MATVTSWGKALWLLGFRTCRWQDTSGGHPGVTKTSLFNPYGTTAQERYGTDLRMVEYLPEQYTGAHSTAAPGRPYNNEALGVGNRVLQAQLEKRGLLASGGSVSPGPWDTMDLDMIQGATQALLTWGLEMGLIQPQDDPAQPPDPPVLPPVTPPVPPVLPVAGLHPLSPAAQRVEELRLAFVPAVVLALPAKLGTSLSDLARDATWSLVKPFAIEALRFYRRLRAKLGDTREIPAEDR